MTKPKAAKAVEPVLKHWNVTATWVRQDRLGEATGQVPTFIVDPAIQGARTHWAARRVAEDILMSGCAPFQVTYHVTVEPIFEEATDA